MTLSPPAKVRFEDCKVLASGIDKLDLSIDVSWPNNDLFKYLDDLKAYAKSIDEPTDGLLITKDQSHEYKFNIRPHGSPGYTWLLGSNDYSLSIANTLEQKSRPSVFANISSEALWRMGNREAVNWLTNLISGIGGSINSVKPSRVDLCNDTMFPLSLWNKDLIDYLVSRALKRDLHFYGNKFTGLSVGMGGKICFRIYDKPHEIATKSKKNWMYDAWGINQVPKGMIILRSEFQIRREALRSLGVNFIEELFEKEPNVWAYSSLKWLKFQDNPGKHHNQRHTFPWWEVVQGGYRGSQGAVPSIRQKAFKADQISLIQEIDGFIASHMALMIEKQGIHLDHTLTIDDLVQNYLRERRNIGNNLRDVDGNVRKKLANHNRVK